MKKFLYCLILTALFSCPALAGTFNPEYVEGEVIVVLDAPSVSPYLVMGTFNKSAYSQVITNQAESFAKPRGHRSRKTYTEIARISGKNIIHLSSENKSTNELIKELSSVPNVIDVQPNYISRPDAIPNDPYYFPESHKDNPLGLWGMNYIGMPKVWDYFTGSDTVVVAVMDTGVDYNHPDLNANMIRDSYGNYGRRFNNGMEYSDAMDTDNHGTHVAGIIGAVGNNKIGVAGVNWRVKMLACRVDVDNKFPDADVMNGIEYILAEKRMGINIRVVNMSFGRLANPASLKDGYSKSVESLSDAGIICVISAGNEARNLNISTEERRYPACFKFENTITVGAIVSGDDREYLSNYGSNYVDIAAPGHEIFSTIVNSYGNGGLTSAAAPHVAGVAALLCAAYPNETAYQIKTRILDGARKVGVTEKYWARGILDAWSAYETPVTGVTVTPKTASIPVGKSVEIKATVIPENATNKNVTWSSSNPSVATVNTSGVVTGVSVGNAEITAKTIDGEFSGSCTVTVTPAPVPVTGVTVEPKSATIAAKNTLTITATVAPANATNKNVTWSSNYPTIATVDASGLVTGVSAGVATITATTVDGGFKASSTITVSVIVSVTGVTVTPKSASIDVGKTQPLTATVAPANATNKNVTWSSSNTAIATVNASGVVTRVSAGNATITARTVDGGFTDYSTITAPVIVSVTGVTVTPKSATIAVGKTQPLTATVAPANATNKTVTWSSSNTAIATVNASGVVTGVSAGVAIITARTADGGFTDTSTITVVVPVTGVSVTPKTASIDVGKTQALTATVAPANATNKNVTWSSSNTAIATVSASGVVTGVSAGTAKITVKTVDGGYTANCDVTVNPTIVKDTEVKTFKELQTAVSNATGPTNIIIAANIPFTSSITISSGKNISIKSKEGIYTFTAAAGYRHFYVNSGASLTLEKITLDGGYTGTGTTTRGGIDNKGNVALKSGVIIQKCYADSGGGIGNWGNLTINFDAIIQKCYARMGGGIYKYPKGTINIDGGVIGYNTATEYGGGIFTDENGTVDINRGVIVGNTASESGGGISTNKATVFVKDSEFTGNTAKNSGGGINSWYGSVTVNNSAFIGNKVQYGGGGICNYYGTVSIDKCEFSGNSTGVDGDGAGVYNYKGKCEIVNSELIGNTADYGAGIYSSEGTVNITDSKIVSNDANCGTGIRSYEDALTITGGEIRNNKAKQIGGGIYLSSLTKVVVSNTIFGGNTAAQAYWMNNTADIATYSKQIKGVTKFSDPPKDNKPFEYAYNNYDISYAKGLTSNPILSKEASTFAQLQTAVNNAAKSTQTNIIVTANITFTNSITISSGKNITIKSKGNNNFVLTATASKRHFVVNSGAALTLENITLDGGYPGTGTIARGGIDNEGNLTLDFGTTIQKCYATRFGGGISNYGNATISFGAIIQNCYATYGGGIYKHPNGTVNVNGGEISLNTAVECGGGIYTDRNGTVTINGGRIISNTTNDSGGGIQSYKASVIIKDSEFAGNTAKNWGGGIGNWDGTFKIDNGKFSNNEAINHGSGIGNWYGTVDINCSEFSGNSKVRDGGGIHNEGGKVSVKDSEFVDNTAEYGGGIYSNEGTVTVNNSEFIGNNANHGGGIYKCKSEFSVEGSEFVGNTANYGGGIYNCEGAITIIGGEIRGNKASKEGGGLYVLSLTKATVTNTVFSGNTANQAYWMNNAADIATYKAQIKGVTKFSAPPAGNKPFEYAYNNYDINYTKGLTKNPN